MSSSRQRPPPTMQRRQQAKCLRGQRSLQSPSSTKIPSARKSPEQQPGCQTLRNMKPSPPRPPQTATTHSLGRHHGSGTTDNGTPPTTQRFHRSMCRAAARPIVWVSLGPSPVFPSPFTSEFGLECGWHPQMWYFHVRNQPDKEVTMAWDETARDIYIHSSG